MLDYRPALRSDLSRFHGIREDPSQIESALFFELAEHIAAYEGSAVKAVALKAQQEHETHSATPPALRQNPAVQEVDAQTALAMLSDGGTF